MNKDNNVQIINGCQYDVNVTQCSIINRACVVVKMLDDTLVGYVGIDHNTESTTVTYRLGQGDYVDGSYNYFELPKVAMYAELASWLVNTHPVNG